MFPSSPNKDSNLVNLIIDAAELSLDTVLDAGVVKDIPVFGSIAKGFDAIRNVKDYLLQRKIYSFLEAARTEPSLIDGDFVLRMNQELEFSEKVGANLLLLIDQLDEVSKPRILGIAFSWLCQNKMTYEEFGRIGSGIRFCLMADIGKLGEWAQQGETAKVHQWGLAAQSLSASGFLFMMPSMAMGGGGYNLSISDLGIKLGKIINLCQSH